MGWLPEGCDDQTVSRQLDANEITAPALSSFALAPLKRDGIVIGFAAAPTNAIPKAVKRMGRVLERCIKEG